MSSIKQLSKEQKKILILSSMGGLLEFYDFTIYGLFAGYFAHQFFPSEDKIISLIASYAVFVIGYIARPVGGILFSHIGDEIGRKIVLILTMLLMGCASLGMGFLPTYTQIGIYAPLLMLFCRLIQGLAIGGELPSMIVYVTESIPDKRGYGMGCIFSGTVGGLIPGMLINLILVHSLTSAQIEQFGWRIPFILGGLLCFIAYRIRRELHETKAFNQLKKHEDFPFIELIRHHLGKVLIGVGLISIMAMSIILVMIFMPTYLIAIANIDPNTASNAVLVATIVSVIAIYFMGNLTVHFNHHDLMRNSLYLVVVAAILNYYLISINTYLTLGLALFAMAQGFVVPLVTSFLSDLFPTRIRLTGVALSYNISFVLFAGMTPIVVTSLIEETGLLYIIPASCLIITAGFSYWALRQIKP